MKELDFLSNKKTIKKEDAPQAETPVLAESGWMPELKSQFKIFRSKYLSANPDDAEVVATDLIQGEVITYFNWKKSSSIFIVLLLVDFLILFGSYQALTFWQASRQNEIDQMKAITKNLDQKVAAAETNLGDIKMLQKKLDLAKGLLENHIYWTNFFDFIEQNTLADVMYSGGFSGNIDGKYSFSGETKDFRYLAGQIYQLRKNGNVIMAVSDGGSVGSQDLANPLSFKLDLTINPSIFLKTDSN